MAYASASKGYRAGGGNIPFAYGDGGVCAQALKALGLTVPPPTFGADSVWTYELGLKGAAFNNHLVVQTSVFYTDWSKIQNGVGLPGCEEGFTLNEGRATIQGFDLQLEANPFDDVKVGASVGYTDAYFPNVVYSPASSTILNVAGDKLGSVEPWTADVHGEYDLRIDRLWAGAHGYVRADYKFLSADNVSNPGDAGYNPKAPYGWNPTSYELLKLRAGAIRDGIDISVFVNNAAHANPRLGLSYLANSDLYLADSIQPFTFGLTFLRRF
jgi:hypothetical protein